MVGTDIYPNVPNMMNSPCSGKKMHGEAEKFNSEHNVDLVVLVLKAALSTQTDWARIIKKRSTGVEAPDGPLCKQCGEICAKAFPDKGIEECINLVKTSMDFRRQFSDARAVKTGKSAGSFRRQDVGSSTCSSISVKKLYIFLTVDQFEARFKVGPRALQLPVDNLWDEEGSPCSGVLLSHDGSPWCSQYRQVEISYARADRVDEEFHAREAQLRAGQGVHQSKINSTYPYFPQLSFRGVCGEVTSALTLPASC
eukprot:6468198-Amphidinium_carterae.4